jgi:hypothetical protein
MAHLSTCVFLSHARLKAKQRSVGGSSPPKLIKSVDDYVRGVRDQIEMAQYIRGRIGERTGARFLTWAAYLAMSQDSRRHWQGKRGFQTRQNTRPSQARRASSRSQHRSDRQETRLSQAKTTSPRGAIAEAPQGWQHSNRRQVVLSPMTGPDQDSPVGGIKTEAQAGEMDMAKVAARLTDRQWTT